MNLRTLAKIFSFFLGLCLALLGAAWAYMATSGAVKSDITESFVAAGGLLLAAAPCLVFPFSGRLAKALLVVFIFAIAVGMLWLVFQPNLPAEHPAVLQVAAIALVVMLVARVGLALRRKLSAPST
ncbi:hypothetical protein ISP17_05100 [Dyella ginsengisoli]|uniref:Uncharacterized protein n=1 Tax=Dyella ginsengisoli TaxID=363848 RepID=A0ABW8JQF9_9GAMM